MGEVVFFKTPLEFRRWLGKNHQTSSELWVGYYKKDTGKPSLTWPESVDEALCFGWIDGQRKSLDAESYMIRFTPRRARSIWSAVNVKRINELTRLGRMQEAGLKVFEQRDPARTEQYSHERDRAELDAAQQALFKRHQKAWQFFQAQPPSYRKAASWWVISAKQEGTRLKRLNTLIADSEQEKWIAQMRRKTTPASS